MMVNILVGLLACTNECLCDECSCACDGHLEKLGLLFLLLIVMLAFFFGCMWLLCHFTLSKRKDDLELEEKRKCRKFAEEFEKKYLKK